MNIVETHVFVIGRFRVVQRPRIDSPGWAQFVVFLDEVLIGKSFSMPDLGCCEWLERQQREQTMYAYSSARLPALSNETRRARHHRNRKIGAPRKPETILDIQAALAGD